MAKVGTLSTDRKWEAERDARILADAQEIQKDPKRIASAKKEAAKMAKDAAKELASLKAVSRDSGSKKKAATKTGKRSPSRQRPKRKQ